MTLEIGLVFAIVLITIALFVSERMRLDVTALLALLSLLVLDLVSVKEAVAGFGSPLIMLIAGLFVVSEGLLRTGVAAQVGQWIGRSAQGSEVRLLCVVMPCIALLSAFMSSTGAVAIFIPIMISLAHQSGIAVSRLLMPLSVAGLVGGMVTLIGTPPNIAVSAELERHGLDPFSFFDFTPIGLVMVAIAVVYMVLVGRRVLPSYGPLTRDTQTAPTLLEMAQRYGFDDQLHRVEILAGSSLVGRTIMQVGLRSGYGVTALSLERKGRFFGRAHPDLIASPLQVGDLLVVSAQAAALQSIIEAFTLRDKGFPHGLQKRFRQAFGVAESLVVPNSPFIGKTVSEAHIRNRHKVNVMSVRRGDQALAFDFAKTRLKAGDVLLVSGSWAAINDLNGPHHDMILLNTPQEVAEAFPNAAKAPYALGITAVMLIAMVSGFLPSVTAVLCAALAMVLAGCVRMEDAYKAMNWQSLVLIAGMLPLSAALQKTGGAALIVDSLMAGLGGYGPTALMAGLFILTSVFSQFISNTATTVLVAPIAYAMAVQAGVSPHGFLMTVAIAASTAFATPVASPVNTLVLGPGGYKFMDFVKIGVPLQLLMLGATMVLIPIFFPL